MSKSIHAACRDGEVKVVERWLRSTECDVNEKDQSGWSPLHCAIHAHQFQIANMLLQHPDICVLSVNRDLSTPLHFAVRSRDEPTEEHKNVLNLLLEKGCLLNGQQKSGYTPLHEAIDKGHISIVSWLVDKGADLNIQSKRGKTALHNCAEIGRLEMASILVERGADVDIKDANGKRCYEYGSNPMIQNLLYSFSLGHIADVAPQWDCGQTDVAGELNFYMNFSRLAEHTNFINMDMFASIFAPIEKEFCFQFVLDLMQVAIPLNTQEILNYTIDRLDVWASCDFCQAIRYLVYASFDQRIAILSERYRSDKQPNVAALLKQKASSLGVLFSECKLSTSNNSIIERFCGKIGESNSTVDSWKAMIASDKDIKRFIVTRYPPRYPILMGTPRWSIMFSFMLGIEVMLTSFKNAPNEETIFPLQITPTITFSTVYPAQFLKLRSIFSVKESVYLRALGASSFLTKLFIFYNLAPYSSKNGKGEFFFSADFRILIQQLDKESFDCCVKFMPQYFIHIEKNTHTLLPKLLGLYSMTHCGETYYFIVQQNMFPKYLCTNKHKKWGLSAASKPLDIGYVKKAQFMERLEVDVTVLQKAGFSNYVLLVGKLKAKKRRSNKPFNEDMLDIKNLLSEPNPACRGSNSPRSRRNRSNTVEYNVEEEEHLFPAIEEGLSVANDDQLYYFQIAFPLNSSKVPDNHRGLKKITRIVPSFHKASTQDQSLLFKQNFLRTIELCFT